MLVPNTGENTLVVPTPLPSLLALGEQVNLSTTLFASESLLRLWAAGDPSVIPPALAVDAKLKPVPAGEVNKEEEEVVVVAAAAIPAEEAAVLSNTEPPPALGAELAGGAPNRKPEPAEAEDTAMESAPVPNLNPDAFEAELSLVESVEFLAPD